MPSQQNEAFWAATERAWKRQPHEPTEMLLGSRSSPIRFWVCPFPKCDLTLHAVGDKPPVCYGGYTKPYLSNATQTPTQPSAPATKDYDFDADFAEGAD